MSDKQLKFLDKPVSLQGLDECANQDQVIAFRTGMHILTVSLPANVTPRQAYCVAVAPGLSDSQGVSCLQHAFPSLSEESASNVHHNSKRTKKNFIERAAYIQHPKVISKVSASVPSSNQYSRASGRARMTLTHRQLQRREQDAELRGARKQNAAVHMALTPVAAILAGSTTMASETRVAQLFNAFASSLAVQEIAVVPVTRMISGRTAKRKLDQIMSSSAFVPTAPTEVTVRRIQTTKIFGPGIQYPPAQCIYILHLDPKISTDQTAADIRDLLHKNGFQSLAIKAVHGTPQIHRTSGTAWTLKAEPQVEAAVDIAFANEAMAASALDFVKSCSELPNCIRAGTCAVAEQAVKHVFDLRNIIACMLAEGAWENVPPGTHVMALLTHLDGQGETTAFKCRLADFVLGTVWEGGSSRIIDMMVTLSNEQSMYTELDVCRGQLKSIESTVFSTPADGVYIRVLHFISVADGLARYILSQQPGGTAQDRDSFRHSRINFAEDIIRFGQFHFSEQYWIDLFHLRQFKLMELEEKYRADHFGRSFTQAQLKRESERLRIHMGSSAVACPLLGANIKVGEYAGQRPDVRCLQRAPEAAHMMNFVRLWLIKMLRPILLSDEKSVNSLIIHLKNALQSFEKGNFTAGFDKLETLLLSIGALFPQETLAAKCQQLHLPIMLKDVVFLTNALSGVIKQQAYLNSEITLRFEVTSQCVWLLMHLLSTISTVPEHRSVCRNMYMSNLGSNYPAFLRHVICDWKLAKATCSNLGLANDFEAAHMPGVKFKAATGNNRAIDGYRNFFANDVVKTITGGFRKRSIRQHREFPKIPGTLLCPCVFTCSTMDVSGRFTERESTVFSFSWKQLLQSISTCHDYRDSVFLLGIHRTNNLQTFSCPLPKYQWSLDWQYALQFGDMDAGEFTSAFRMCVCGALDPTGTFQAPLPESNRISLGRFNLCAQIARRIKAIRLARTAVMVTPTSIITGPLFYYQDLADCARLNHMIFCTNPPPTEQKIEQLLMFMANILQRRRKYMKPSSIDRARALLQKDDSRRAQLALEIVSKLPHFDHCIEIEMPPVCDAFPDLARALFDYPATDNVLAAITTQLESIAPWLAPMAQLRIPASSLKTSQSDATSTAAVERECPFCKFVFKSTSEKVIGKHITRCSARNNRTNTAGLPASVESAVESEDIPADLEEQTYLFIEEMHVE